MHKPPLLAIGLLDLTLLRQEVTCGQPQPFAGQRKTELLCLGDPSVGSSRLERVAEREENRAAEEEWWLL